MALKETKRKGFNFFRSYYDVYNELDDNSKVQFIDALLDRQFLGVKPNELKGMASFAYISQVNSIDSQVKGYEDKTNTKLTDPPTVGVKEKEITPTLQVQVQVKGKGKVKEEIPTEAVFIAYAFKQGKRVGLDLDLIKVKLKYNSWIENDWKTGGDIPKQIRSWKVTLNNTLVYLKKDVRPEDKPFKYEY